MLRRTLIAISAALVSISLSHQPAEARPPICATQYICVYYCPLDVDGWCESYALPYCEVYQSFCSNVGPWSCEPPYLQGDPQYEIQCDYINI